jgi:putative ABC transport system permease protein
MATVTPSKPTSFDRTLASARSTMMFSEVVGLAVDSFRASKTRFMLTMLGMVAALSWVRTIPARPTT